MLPAPSALWLAPIVMITARILGAEADDGWRNLKQVTHDRDYTVIFRDGHCAHGSLLSVSERAAVLGSSPGKDLSIERRNIVRVSDTSLAPAHDAIFSGRSSWIDVKEAGPRSTESLRVVTKRGKESYWRQPAISDDSVAFEGKIIGKSEVRYVFYIRVKPLTKREEHVHHENADLLEPRLWFHSLMLGKISVLLYNSEIPEDNSPLGCR